MMAVAKFRGEGFRGVTTKGIEEKKETENKQKGGIGSNFCSISLFLDVGR